ncbi:MAG: phosphoribosylformylglycinamidine cyclo-ligase, partial [Betaproteobacteria bacterium]|nr:phosphoribosylformylglycinamidine cyclo-ligase [Betaproteobacteria bacterium]
MATDSNSYRRAGVNIDAGDAALARIKPKLRQSAAALSAHGAALLPGAGGFAAAVRLPQLAAPSIVVCADGVGTKTALLAEYDMPEVAGVDAVAMCVNDLLCAGARPLLFLDY